jgi:hypothetical protein
MKDTVVVYCTYDRALHGGFLDNFKKYKDQQFENIAVLFDNKIKASQEDLENKFQAPVITYTNQDFIDNNFNRPIDPRHRWGSHQNPNYFYAHFRMLLYYLKNKQYKYYWFFDDDVFFNNNLKQLLQSYEDQNYDFLAVQAFKGDDYDECPHVSKVNRRMQGSHGDWLRMAPGPGDNYKSVDRHLGCFFPMVRFSNRAMKQLIELNEQGFYGYSEGFVPTALASDGFIVASMLDEWDQYFVKHGIDCIPIHKNIPFTWSWI